jgi:uncharacterized membrane protein
MEQLLHTVAHYVALGIEVIAIALGLTFQMAADVVNTSFEPTWDELGRLATIAAIRTFLSFFLDREVEDTRDLQHRGVAAKP